MYKWLKIFSGKKLLVKMVLIIQVNNNNNGKMEKQHAPSCFELFLRYIMSWKQWLLVICYLAAFFFEKIYIISQSFWNESDFVGNKWGNNGLWRKLMVWRKNFESACFITMWFLFLRLRLMYFICATLICQY